MSSDGHWLVTWDHITRLTGDDVYLQGLRRPGQHADYPAQNIEAVGTAGRSYARRPRSTTTTTSPSLGRSIATTIT